MFHYTDDTGFKSIGSAPSWLFRASQPPGDHPFGAYFTDYDRSTTALALKLRIPKSKIAYFFSFTDAGDLKPLEGGRGRHIFYSSSDYVVGPERQLEKGATDL